MKHSFFENRGMWLKGNIHSHTTVSDGVCEPDRQIRDYRDRGYDFLAVTDHNIMDSFQQELEGICLIPGWERDITYSKTKCVHLVGLSGRPAGEQKAFSMERPDPSEVTVQQLTDSMRADGQFVVLAHPVFSRMEPAEISNLTGYQAIEVFNMGCERICHAGRADVYWDMLLRAGRRVLGIACDDTHGKTQKSDRFGGWISVNAREKSGPAIMEAVGDGNFYSTMGPEIYDWGIEDGAVYVCCSPVKEIHFVTYPPRGAARYAGENMMTGDRYELKGSEAYVRVECVDAFGNTAWTNPAFAEGLGGGRRDE